MIFKPIEYTGQGLMFQDAARKDRHRAAWRIDRDPSGWLAVERPLVRWEGDPLSDHDGWDGPVKLVRTGRDAVQRIDLRLERNDPNDLDYPAEEGRGAGERLEEALLDLAGAWFEGRAVIGDWMPPDAERLASWIARAGPEPVADAEGRLRLVLKRHGCDGQVRIVRRKGRLRFIMPLGRFEGLAPSAAAAMACLALDANARCRLARIVRAAEDRAERWEAQVDLTGLPWDPSPDAAVRGLWEETTRSAVLALDLALRRLGQELPLLAESGESELARWILDHRKER